MLEEITGGILSPRFRAEHAEETESADLYFINAAG